MAQHAAPQERVDGVGLLDLVTAPQTVRTIGELVSRPLLNELSDPLTGFENHRGGTVLGASARPLGAVTKGAGNRMGDGFDGAVQGSVVATYMHGPCLARNPELADWLLTKVVGELPPLDLDEVALLRRRTRSLGFEFLKPARSGRTVVEVEGLALSAGEKHLLDSVSFALERGELAIEVAVEGVVAHDASNPLRRSLRLSE